MANLVSNPTLPTPPPIPTTFSFFATGARQPWLGDNSFLSLDAATLVTHASEAEVTEHAVEYGSDITDNVRPKPDSLTIEGFISNVPIQTVFDGSEAPPYGLGRAKAAFDLLRQLKTSATVFDVITEIHQYYNMVIETLSFPQDAMTGDSLKFTVKLKSIRVVTSQTLRRTPAVAHAADPKKSGNQPTTPAATATNKSAAAAGLDGITNLIKKIF